jgi:soluble lytic murein transglycosylase-like protein
MYNYSPYIVNRVYLCFGIFISILIIFCILLFDENKKLQTEALDLREKEQQLVENLQRKSKNLINTQNTLYQERALNIKEVALAQSGQINEYKQWKESKKVATILYEESKGKFNKEWGQFLALQAFKHDIDPFIVYELLKVETGGTFNPKSLGPRTQYGRAYGMAQFMTNTAPWIAKMAGLHYDKEKLFDPHFSIILSVTYLDYLHSRYKNWDKALTAYHRGMGGMESFLEEKGHAKSWYAQKIKTNSSNY